MKILLGILIAILFIAMVNETFRGIIYFGFIDLWKITKYRRIMKLCIIFLLATLIF